MYEMDYRAHERVMFIRTWGFWDVATMATFTTQILARGMAIRLRHGQCAVLADLRAAPIQPAEVTPGIELLIRKSLTVTSAPIAAVVGSMLAKLQSQRVLTTPNCRTFLDMDEANAWLDAEWRDRLRG